MSSMSTQQRAVTMSTQQRAVTQYASPSAVASSETPNRQVLILSRVSERLVLAAPTQTGSGSNTASSRGIVQGRSSSPHALTSTVVPSDRVPRPSRSALWPPPVSGQLALPAPPQNISGSNVGPSRGTTQRRSPSPDMSIFTVASSDKVSRPSRPISASTVSILSTRPDVRTNRQAGPHGSTRRPARIVPIEHTESTTASNTGSSRSDPPPYSPRGYRRSNAGITAPQRQNNGDSNTRPANADQRTTGQSTAENVSQNNGNSGSSNSGGAQQPSNNLRNYIAKLRKRVHCGIGDRIDESEGFKSCCVCLLILMYMMTFTRLVAGSTKLQSGCDREKQVSEYLFIKSWVGFIFWIVLSCLMCLSEVGRALQNPFFEVYIVANNIFSLIWLILGCVCLLILMYMMTFTRLVAGSTKLQSGCDREKQVSEYLFIKSWVGFIFWIELSCLMCLSEVGRALQNPFFELYIVADNIFSLIWLILGSVWTLHDIPGFKEECRENKGDWNQHFYNFAIFLTVFDLFCTVLYVIGVLIILCDDAYDEV